MPKALALVSFSAFIMDHVIAFAPALRALEAFWPTRTLKLFLALLLSPKLLVELIESEPMLVLYLILSQDRAFPSSQYVLL